MTINDGCRADKRKARAEVAPEVLAETAWLTYRDDYLRADPWCDPRRAGRRMRKREFVAGFLAALGGAR